MVGRTRRHVVRLPEDVADDSRFCLAHIEAVDADAGAGKSPYRRIPEIAWTAGTKIRASSC